MPHAHNNPAKSFYEEFQGLHIPTLGALPDLEQMTGELSAERKRIIDTYRPYISKTAAAAPPDDGLQLPRRTHVPSPWHAWVLLREIQEQVLVVRGGPEGRDSDNLLVFRGQSRADYLPIPTLFRQGVHQATERRAVEILQVLLESAGFWSRNGVDLTENGVLATARHYGIATPFLDVTADVNTAIWFASRSNESEPRTAVVFIWDLIGPRRDHASLIMPPPIVERLYRQRAAFIGHDPERPIDEFLKPVASVTFPFDSNFEFIEQGTIDEGRDEDPWLPHAARCAKNWALTEAAGPGQALPTETVSARAANDPRLVNGPDNFPSLPEWIESFFWHEEWFVRRLVADPHDQTRVQEARSQEARDLIIRDNEHLMRIVIDLTDRLVRSQSTLHRDALPELVDFWRRGLSENLNP